jgi:hypothetical protein
MQMIGDGSHKIEKNSSQQSGKKGSSRFKQRRGS